jgi:hypothetical protein
MLKDILLYDLELLTSTLDQRLKADNNQTIFEIGLEGNISSKILKHLTYYFESR